MPIFVDPYLPRKSSRRVYTLKNGDRIPSVTQIIGRFKDSDALIHWAWKCGVDGKNYRAERDRAADAGTMAHAAVEAHIRSTEFTFTGNPEVCARAQIAFNAFLEWAEQTRLRVTHSELPLVSEKYRFGGTIDAVVMGNKRAAADWKSSKSLYPEFLIQVAAYGALWDENFPNDPIVGGYHLVRFDKVHGDFTHRWWGELERAWIAFRHLRALYEIEKELQARTA
jgi:hypothetical protein